MSIKINFYDPVDSELLKRSAQYLDNCLKEIRGRTYTVIDPITGEQTDCTVSEEATAWVEEQLLKVNAQVMRWKERGGGEPKP